MPYKIQNGTTEPPRQNPRDVFQGATRIGPKSRPRNPGAPSGAPPGAQRYAK